MRPIQRLLISSAVVASVALVAACGSGSPTPTPPPAVPPAASAPAAQPSTAFPVLPSGLVMPSIGALGQGPDASSVVTADMAAAVIGGSPQKVTIPGLGGAAASIVAYTTTSGDTLTALVEKLPGGIPAASLQAAIQMAGSKGTLQPVSGLGDAAGKVVTTNDATVAFAKGDLIVVLAARSDTTAGADLDPKLEALAQQVVGKL